ncbi:MAG TPA: protein translocase subunit SecF [Sphingomonadaceae bacterium]|nr:protein translocase subunit SecF [Sphingomonadaceae bacterium]
MRLLKLVPDNTNFDFLRWRFVTTGISILLIAASIALIATRGFNLGVDFVGGQMIRVGFSEQVKIDELRKRIEALNLGEATIQQFGNKDVSIRMPLPEGGDAAANQAAERVKQAILAVHPNARFDAVETVSGKVSEELFTTGAWATGLAMLGIAIYIWFRFEWQFGISALLSLFHDVMLTLGFFALTQLQFDLNIVAAVLTIVGYSLNDTIVVYDRIREDLRKYRKMDIVALLNGAVNETLARTIMTSVTMMLALAILLFMGPENIFGLTAAILLGIVIGTYSSIYVAAPMLIWLKVGPNSFVPAKTRTDGERVGGREQA